jgi:hypothetical protein
MVRIDASWSNLKKKAIFREFIDSGRDAILKEYDFRVGQGVTVRPGTGTYDLRTGQRGTAAPSGPTTYHYAIHGGPSDGQDPRNVVQAAIQWWEQELAAIEADAERGAGSV